MPNTEELTAQIEVLEQERQSLAEALQKAETQITKWKFKFNSKNAEYILLHHEFEEYKKQKNFWPWTLVVILSAITLYLWIEKT